MTPLRSELPRTGSADVAALRAQISTSHLARGPALSFGLSELDSRLDGGGLDGAALHEVAAATATLTDDAAATLFIAGIAARFAGKHHLTVLWALTKFDLYAPALEQVGLGPGKLLYAQARKDSEVLAVAEDALRDGSLACVVAEVKGADRTATRRLQLAASDSGTPILLYRRHRSKEKCPLGQPSAAMTRWRIGCLPSARLTLPGVGRGHWSVELVRQRNGNPFSLELEACDDTGRLALPAATGHRAPVQAGTASFAA
ncbi:protein ImuA [Novosphingobium sp. G106]|uniref:ImuA family protein n=1 Tax=Novosphingobium sp. G106 TaxID=2849500 RepID=UPI001C2D73E7|nr:protein ImuA [Novosphingobium sp. G106]MBV1687823.1 protein ImuA [Novosphingobium sp. G106]